MVLFSFYACVRVYGMRAANGVGEYLCMNNVLKAHAKTYRLYRRKYYKTQKGKISITINAKFMYAVNSSRSDVGAEHVDRAMQFQVDYYRFRWR